MTNFTDRRPGIIRLQRVAPVLLIGLALSACAPGPTKRSPGTGLPVGASPASASPAPVTPETPARGDPDQRFQEALALMKARRIEAAQAAFLALSRDLSVKRSSVSWPRWFVRVAQ